MAYQERMGSQGNEDTLALWGLKDLSDRKDQWGQQVPPVRMVTTAKKD